MFRIGLPASLFRGAALLFAMTTAHAQTGNTDGSTADASALLDVKSSGLTVQAQNSSMTISTNGVKADVLALLNGAGYFMRLLLIMLFSFIWIQQGLAQCVLAITKQPVGATKCVSDTYSFSVTNTGLGTYQWQKDGVNLIDKAGTISGATTTKLTLTNLCATCDPGDYALVLTGTGACQGQTARSNTARLIVNSPAEITTQPTNQQTCENSIATFSVRTSGIVSGYQWFRNGEPINGATSRDYLVRVNNTLNGNKYKVAVTSSCGTVTSSEATLEVTPRPAITLQPVGATECVGDDYSFIATAINAGGYQWQKDNVDLVDVTGRISGSTTNQLTLTNLCATCDPGSYVLEVEGVDACAATVIRTTAAALMVNEPATITAQPSPQQVREGSTATFVVEADGEATGYQWYRNGTAITGATSAIYGFTTSNSNDNDKFKVDVLSSCGTVTSNEVTLEVTANPTRLYVDASAGETNSGLNWADAFTDLQTALNYAANYQSVTEIWVAKGVYKPLQDPDDSDSRLASFRMRNGVAIYGGFVGTETNLNARPAINPFTGKPSSTTLSGDIGTPGVNNDNSYHVINNINNIDYTAVLDGFVIADGNANGAGTRDKNGAGLYNDQSSPTLTNCSLVNNFASGDGGGIFNTNGSSPTLINCSLLNNSASKGGGMANTGNSNPSLTNCSLQANTATDGGGGGIYNAGGSNPRLYNSSLINNSASKGGAIYANASSAVLINCSLLNNTATSLGGGIYSKAGSELSLANCVLWNNGAGNSLFKDETTALGATYSLFDKTVTGYNTDGTGNKTTTTSPFASANTVALAPGSPAIDAGSNAAYEKGPETDLAGNPRFFPTGGTIDMGAIESQTAPVPTLTLVVTANPTTILTTGTTTLSATVSGGTSPYSYIFSGPGIISQSPGISGASRMGTNDGPLPGGNTATVSGLTAGVKTFTVTASDNTTPTSQTISGTVSVTVTQVNRPPTAPTFVNQTVTVGTAFAYTVYGFSDPDGDPLEYSVSIDPVNGFSFDPDVPTVSGTPITTGVSTVTVTVTDPGKLSTSAIFTITVTPAVLIRYVKTGGTGDGSSWTNASGDLQAMIDAPGVEQVWVAGGIFKPTTTSMEPRRASFRMKNKVAIYGGFTGAETSLAARPPVNPVTDTPSSTTLSGDIGIPGDNSDNSYHVFYHFYDSQLNGTAVLDGFVITSGNANTVGGFDNIGAGILNLNSSPTLVNCSLQSNSATSDAGGIYNSGSSPTLTNCKLQGNSASSGGGIVNTNGSSPTLTNCSLLNNSAVNSGGGIFNTNGSSPRLINCSLQNNSASVGGALYNTGSNPTLVNCSLQNNSSKQVGGALFNSGSNPTLVNCSLLSNSASEGGGIFSVGGNSVLTNCVLWNNGAGNTISNNSSTVTATYSLFDNTVMGYTGTNNKTTTTSPFASANPGTPADVSLAANSPAIDAGSNEAYTTANGPAVDLVANPRIFPQNGTGTPGRIDMGAVEFQTAPVVSSPFAITGVTTVSCTTLSAGQRQLSFVPRYSGLTGSPVSFSVLNELSPTTAPGPYSLKVYADNPIITLKAVQSGTSGEASFAYNWLAACNAGSNPPANQAPTTTGIANQTATVGQAFSLNVALFFSDPNGDALSYQAGGLPAGLSLSGSTISGISVASSVSSVTVTASDPGSLSVSAIFVLTVNPATGPNPPTAPFSITGVTTVSCTTLSAGQRQLSFVPQYSGLTGSPVSFSVVNELSPTTAPGPYSLKVYTDNPIITLKAVQSGTAGEASFAYNWLAACNAGSNPPANQAPTTTGIANQSATVGQAFSLNVAPYFSDPNGDALSYQAGGLPAGLSLNGSTISGIPGASSVSSVTVTATDPGSLSVPAIFVLTVNQATGPNPPTAPFSITGVTTVSCTVLSAGQRQLSFVPQYVGLSGQPVSFSVVNELSPTTAPGPYSLKVYTDNPVITLKAVQSGTVGEASFAYNWLAACNAGSRQGIVSDAGLQVLVRGNPLTTESVTVEVRGVQGQPLRLEVLNQLGYPVSTVNQESAADVERVQVRVGSAGGLYFLRVSTPNQQEIIKLLKQ